MTTAMLPKTPSSSQDTPDLSVPLRRLGRLPRPELIDLIASAVLAHHHGSEQVVPSVQDYAKAWVTRVFNATEPDSVLSVRAREEAQDRTGGTYRVVNQSIDTYLGRMAEGHAAPVSTLADRVVNGHDPVSGARVYRCPTCGSLAVGQAVTAHEDTHRTHAAMEPLPWDRSQPLAGEAS